jgi:hypothetical protein
METSTLQTPKTGRSRFSKALPAPPSFLSDTKSKFKSNLPSLPPSLPSLPPQLPPLSLGFSTANATARTEQQQQTVTRIPVASPRPPDKLLPPINAGPPLPPPKQLPVKEAPAMAAVSRPLDSPLPPIPRKLAAQPPMTIPRRPVAAAPPPVAVVQAAPALAPAPASPAASPSPVGSISSLLSAYSNHSAESTPRSSTNSANDLSSAKGSYSTISPGEPAKDSLARLESPSTTLSSPSSSDRNAQKQEVNRSRNPAAYDQDLPPPPPLKDNHRPNTPPVDPKPQTQLSQSPTATQPQTPLTNSSPQQDQLWRRRSLRSEKNLAVPELKLVTSHGSTAASAVISSQAASSSPNQQQHVVKPQDQPQSTPSAAGSRVSPSAGANPAFPGRNIRPVASRQQIVAQGEDNMGQKASNLVRDLASKGQESNSAIRTEEKDATRAPPPAPDVSPMKPMPNIAAPHSIARLPTPEYESSDVKHPIVQTVVSPVSPASSPDLPTDPKSAVARKTVREVENQVRHAKSSPALAPKTGIPAFAGRPPVGLPSSPAANRDRTPNQSQFPTRTSSRLGDQHRPSAAAARREAAGAAGLPVPKQREQQFRPVQDDMRTISENGSTASDETVKPKVLGLGVISGNDDSVRSVPQPPPAETEELDHTDNPGAALFPRNWYKPLPADEVMDARPLENKHFRCLTGHRYMTAARQRVNPIACRTCGQKDRNAECYICSACHLNICASCTGKLRRCRGDLDQLLRLKEKDAEGGDTPESTQDTARPDSETFTIPPTDPPLSFVIEAH